MKRLSVFILFAVLFPICVNAQGTSGKVDSLVSLISAKSMELIEKDGINYRKVTGPARFLHNDTFLICDTALWNVNTEEIEAIGHVKILQNETVLTSDNLKYIIPLNLAQFRGTLVQLEDKNRNILRTKCLDYNTKDSVAIFMEGGSLKDKDGQVIESITGTYDSKIKTFTFSDNVNMFTDSVYVKTTRLEYEASKNLAKFGYGTDAWKDDDMISSNDGWYDRNKDIFLFNTNVHGLTKTREGWADSLYFHRKTMDIEMYGNVQVSDSINNVYALAGKAVYIDSLSRLEMTRRPAIVGITKDTENKEDSLYFGADSLVYRTIKKCDIDSVFLAQSKTRLNNLSTDAITAYRKKAAIEAAKAAEEAAKNDPNKLAEAKSKELKQKRTDKVTKEQNKAAKEQIPPLPQKDSLHVKDTVPKVLPKDSTKMGFLTAIRNVKMFRKDIQIACDSLEYSDVDSIVRLFKVPLVWNEKGRHQYSADSLYAVIKNGRMQKADLLSNAFVIVQETDTVSYDQIRGAEMLAYFDSTSALRRFDVLGDAAAIFYLMEDSTFSTVNKSEAKMLYAEFKGGDIDKLSYFQDVKSDAYPLAQMSPDDKSLKGYKWLPNLRPKNRYAITSQNIRPSERTEYESRPRASFTQTDIYFPGYMAKVYKEIAKRKEENARRVQQRDSLLEKKDTVTPVLNDAKIVKIKTEPKDSLRQKNTISVPQERLLSTMESNKLARLKKRVEKAALLKAKWAKLDSLDAAKEKMLAEERAEKLRQRKLKMLKAIQAHEAKDKALFEKYKAMYQKRKELEEKKKARHVK